MPYCHSGSDPHERKIINPQYIIGSTAVGGGRPVRYRTGYRAYRPHKQMDSINNKPGPFYKKVSMGEGLTINCAVLCLDELLC